MAFVIPTVWTARVIEVSLMDATPRRDILRWDGPLGEFMQVRI